MMIVILTDSDDNDIPHTYTKDKGAHHDEFESIEVWIFSLKR